MKILIFGKNGQVGWELNRSLQPLGEIIAVDVDEIDFTDSDGLRKIIQTVKPSVICNAVAYTAVDKAEEEEALALTINGTAPGIIAEEVKKLNALLIHYSTDYVFDGTKTTAYLETDEPNPTSAYGRTKREGELAVQLSGCDYLTLRTSWVYASRANNFLLTMLKLVQEREELSIVSDQIGAPTTARLIADVTLLCIQQSLKERLAGNFSSDLYHLAAAGHTSWHGFTEEIVKQAKNNLHIPLAIKNIKAIPTTNYPTPATRPMNSQLVLTKLESTFGLSMPVWQDSLGRCMAEKNITYRTGL
ncbi:dTDP-4-dehydrorhamnose reductase [hydrothermal vent metagenome]|uniref:dTDP-4-dehydrorhamnose reductase n=1 Tax=hydrothermal vent metagenome TaxID=652676 RepID=A0A3B0X0E7_9ZZZZ